MRMVIEQAVMLLVFYLGFKWLLECKRLDIKVRRERRRQAARRRNQMDFIRLRNAYQEVMRQALELLWAKETPSWFEEMSETLHRLMPSTAGFVMKQIFIDSPECWSERRRQLREDADAGKLEAWDNLLNFHLKIIALKKERDRLQDEIQQLRD
jgi:hypothetical protein